MKQPTNPQEFSISIVWSQRIALSRFVQLPKLLFLHQGDLGITSSELNVLLDILYFKWTSEHPFVTYGTLGRMSGMSEQTVRNNVTRLKEKGYLKKIDRGGNRPKAYDLTPLIKMLESFPQIPTKTNPQGAQIQTPTYSKMDSPEYPNMNTELYAANEKNFSRRTGSSGKLEHISDAIPNLHHGP